METSRKRFNNEKDSRNKKRRSRKSKTKPNEQEIIEKEWSETQDEDDIHITDSDNSEVITLRPVQTCSQSYTEEDDKKIIKYFKGNMSLLGLREDFSIFHLLKEKLKFQNSVRSLQSRFQNVILPNLFKYNVMNHADLIDFYDAAKLELPEEFIKILSVEETSNEKSTSVQTENIAIPGTPRQVAGTSSGKKCNSRKNSRNEIERTGTPVTSRQFDSKTEDTQIEDIRTEVACAQSSTSEEMTLKSILGFIQFSNSKNTCVFIPDTEPNIPLIKNRLLDEFQIQPDSIKILPKSIFDKLKQIKEQLDIYKKIMINAFLNHSNGLVESMFPDAMNLLKFMQERNRPQSQLQISNSERQPSQTQISDSENQPSQTQISDSENQPNEALTTFADDTSWAEIQDMGQLIASLSDSFDQVSISSIPENQECLSPNISLDAKQMKSGDQDDSDTETIILSHYFDHTYCKDNKNNIDTNVEATSLSPSPSNNDLDSTQCTRDSSDLNDMDSESNSPDTSYIENACIPQIIFSKRCQEKILKENVNVDNLLVDVSTKNQETPNVNCDTEDGLANNSNI